jgi:hypothetical protein
MQGQSNAHAAAAPEEIAGDSRREQQANLVEQGCQSTYDVVVACGQDIALVHPSMASLLEVEPHRGRTIPSPSTLPVSTRLGRVRINDAPRSDSTKYEVLREGLGASYRLRSSC